MTTPSKKDPFDTLEDVYLAELMATSDDEVLADEDGDAVKAEGLKILDAAREEAGRMRLTTAKAQAAAHKARPASGAIGTISVDEARAFLRKAANDPRYTLAARGLDEMTDEDALRLYEQLQRLQSDKDHSESDK